MNLLDIIITCTMLFFVVRGLMRGFIKEIASLAGVILGILLAIRFQPQVTDILKSYLPPGQFLGLIGFAAVFFSTLILCNLLGWGFKLLFQKVLLGWVDRTLGVGLAVAKGVILAYLVIVLLTFFLPARAPLIASSRLAPLIITSYQSMIHLISPDHYQQLRKKIVGTKREIEALVSGKKQNQQETP